MAGKPYTISEYNHAFPNRFETEMMPVLTAYASLHDTDGLMFYDYNGGSPEDWENDFVDGYFSIHRNNALMGLSPVFAYAYRKKLIDAVEPLTISYNPEYVFGQIPQEDNFGRWGKFMPYDNRIALTQPIRTAGYESVEPQDLSAIPDAETAPYVANNDQIVADPTKGILKVNTPDFVSISGFLDAANIPSAGPLKLSSGSDFGVLGWLSLTDEPLNGSERSLFVLSSKIQNQGMVWDGIQTVHNQWGTTPTEIFPLEVDLELDITADSLRIYPLNPIGAESSWVTYTPASDGKFYLSIDQAESQRLWYGLEAFGIVVGQEELVSNNVDIQVFPNPAHDNIEVSFNLEHPEQIRFRLCDLNGRQVKLLQGKYLMTGQNTIPIALDNLVAGVYVLRIEIGEALYFKKLIIQ